MPLLPRSKWRDKWAGRSPKRLARKRHRDEPQFDSSRGSSGFWPALKTFRLTFEVVSSYGRRQVPASFDFSEVLTNDSILSQVSVKRRPRAAVCLCRSDSSGQGHLDQRALKELSARWQRE